MKSRDRRSPAWNGARSTVAAGLALALVAGLPASASAHHNEFVDKTDRGVTELVSISSLGEQGDSDSGSRCNPDGYSISDDGRFIAFGSMSGNLHPSDTNGQLLSDVFVHDRKRGTTKLVSATPLGMAPDAPDDAGGGCHFGSFMPSISGNGRYVAFVSNLPLVGNEDVSIDEFGIPFHRVYVHDIKKGKTELVSETWNGDPALGPSGSPVSISDDGRYVAFASQAANILDGVCSTAVAANCWQLYVRDRAADVTRLVSKSSSGEPGNDKTYLNADISGDGRFVAFDSSASNLTDTGIDNNLSNDVFVHDLKTGDTELVSVSRDGTSGNFDSWGGISISNDGRFVAFRSYAMNLVPANLPTVGTNGGGMTYVRDRKKQRTERANVTSSGTMTWSGTGRLSLGGHGRYVLVTSYQHQSADARYPVDESHDSRRHVLVDRRTGQADTVASDRDWDAEKTASPGAGLSSASITADAETLVGLSLRSDVVQNDTNDAWDVFVRDIERRPLRTGFLSTETGSTRRAIAVPAGTTIGSDGVAVLADRPDDALLAGVGAEILQTRIAHRPDLDDLHVKIDVDRLATPTSITGLLGASMLYGARFTIEDSTYELRAQGLGGPLLQGGGTFGLFDCTGTCTEIAELKGGYGTVGENVVASIPLRHLGLQRGGEITDIEVFAGPGSYLLGLTELLDSAGR